MSNLSQQQKFMLGIFIFAAASAIVTFLLDGSVQTLGYMLLAFGFAAFVVVVNGERKSKI